MNELQAVAKFLTATLGAAAPVTALVAGRIFEDLAPQGTAKPYALFSFNSGRDVRAIGADRRVLTEPLVLVKGVAEGVSYAGADALASVLDDAARRAEGTVTISGQSYLVSVVGRETPVRYQETLEGGRRVFHSGGLYRLYVCAP